VDYCSLVDSILKEMKKMFRNIALIKKDKVTISTNTSFCSKHGKSMMFTVCVLMVLFFQQIAFSVDYKITNPQCDEGKTYWYGGNAIYTCNSGKLEASETCAFGVDWENDTPTCIRGIIVGHEPNTQTLNNPNQGFINGGLFVLLLILGAAILSKNKKNNELPTQSTRFCSKCGSGLNKNSKFCPECGKRV